MHNTCAAFPDFCGSMAAISLQRSCVGTHVPFRAKVKSELHDFSLSRSRKVCLRGGGYPGHPNLLNKAQPLKLKLSQSDCPLAKHRIVAQAVESSTAAPQSESPPAENGAEEKKGRRRPGEAKGFVEEMRIKAMKLHTRGQAKDGEAQEKETQQKPLPQWKPTVEGYIQVRTHLEEASKLRTGDVESWGGRAMDVVLGSTTLLHQVLAGGSQDIDFSAGS